MTTCRDTIKRAMRMIGAVDAGADPSGQEEADGLTAFQSILLALPGIGLGGAWRDVDVSADYTAGENERIRITAGSPTITLPQTVPAQPGDNLGCTLADFLGTPDAYVRAPLNGACVQVVGGVGAGLWFYSATIGDWVELSGLEPTTVQPLGPEHDEGLAAVLAVTLAPEFGPEASPTVQRMAQRGLRDIRLRFAQPVVVFAGTPLPSHQSFGRWC